MGNCCQNSSGPNRQKSNLGRWLLGGFAVVIAISWVFQDKPVVDILAPVVIAVLVLTWFIVLMMRRMGVKR